MGDLPDDYDDFLDFYSFYQFFKSRYGTSLRAEDYGFYGYEHWFTDEDEDDSYYESDGDERESDIVDVYTDGACLRNGMYGAQAGIGVYWGPNDPKNVSKPVKGRRATNQVAEIQAVSAAIEKARDAGIDRIRINLDSKFVMDCVLKYMATWRRNGWRKTNGQECKNRADLEVLDKLLRCGDVEVQFVHVKGHNGNKYNEIADKMARKGAARF